MASILAGTYIASQRYFRQHRYAKERTKSNSTERYHNLNFVRQHGIIGEVIALHIKLILRSKRLRSTFIFSFLFILYGLLFYRENNADTMTVYAMIANIIVSSLMLMQQQFVIRWDCAFFDGLMAQAITSRTYIRSHYIILMILNAASFILSTPYFLMGEEIVYLHISLFLWNSGIGTIFILLMACFNKGYIEVMSRSVMNQQGQYPDSVADDDGRPGFVGCTEVAHRYAYSRNRHRSDRPDRPDDAQAPPELLHTRFLSSETRFGRKLPRTQIILTTFFRRPQ